MHLGIVILATSSLLVAVAGKLDTAYEWKYIDYVWPSKAKRQEAIRTGAYDIASPIPTGFAVSHDRRVFVAVIGGKVPARLGVISSVMTPAGPLLEPYPSWDWTDMNNCDSIIMPFRIEIDRCNRLWVADSAQSGGKSRKCHPKLLAFDLNTNTLITKVVLPESIATNSKTNSTLLTNVRVETHGTFCEDTTVYLADSAGNGLIIWDGSQLYRIESPTFNPQPEATNFTVGPYSEKMSFGILGLDISPRVLPNEPQYLYIRQLTSYGLYAARLDQLKNAAHRQPIEISGAHSILSSQSIGHAFSSLGTLFMSSTKGISLICWNRYRNLNKQNLVTVAQDNERYRYINEIKVIPETIFGEEEVWAMSDQLVRYDIGNVWNVNEVNIRILRSPVRRLIAGTKCELPQEVYHQLEAFAAHGYWV